MSNFETENYYNAEHKIWLGPEVKKIYDDALTIGQILYKELHNEPDKICQISHTENTKLTKQQLLCNSIKVATFLRKSGIRQSDIIGLIASNTTHLSAVAYGCLFNATPFHAVNPNLEEITIKNLYEITKPKMIFCDGQNYDKIKNANKQLKARIITISDHINCVESILDVLQTKCEINFRPTDIPNVRQQIIAILCSSGTTGTPKAVTISNTLFIEHNSYLTASDVQYSPSTLDWITGFMTLMLAGIYGTTRIITKELFTPELYLTLLETYKITWSIIASSHLAVLVNCSKTSAEKLTSLKQCYFVGGKCNASTVLKMCSHFKSNGILRNAYGFTELGAVATTNANVESKPNSVGRPAAGIRIKIVDDKGNALGPKELGEICCSNGQHWYGYYNNELATLAMQDAQGWFHTGDIGYFDEQHFLYIVQRKKDMLKYLGMMYYPYEVEDIIAELPQVADVCVFGVWNEEVGDAAAAAVVKMSGSKLSAQDVIDYVAAKTSVKYKQLNAGCSIVSDLQKNANGKIDRAAIKETYLKLNNIREE